MINKVILVGNLGRDPEVRSTPSGQAVANLSVATTSRYKDKDSGEWQEKTEWHRVVVWGRQAEVAGQYLKKGRQIYLEGRLQTRSWEDKQSGEKKYSTEVVCDLFKMLGKRDDAGGGSYGSQGGDSGGFSGGGGAPSADDDIPF